MQSVRIKNDDTSVAKNSIKAFYRIDTRRRNVCSIQNRFRKLIACHVHITRVVSYLSLKKIEAQFFD